MDPVIDKWLAGLLARPTIPLKAVVSAIGVRDKHLGPTWQKAEVEVELAPSSNFAAEIVDAVSPCPFVHLEWALFGVLDVLMVSDLIDMNSTKITIRLRLFDEIESSNMAFREAGRDAGHRLLTTIRESWRLQGWRSEQSFNRGA